MSERVRIGTRRAASVRKRVCAYWLSCLRWAAGCVVGVLFSACHTLAPQSISPVTSANLVATQVAAPDQASGCAAPEVAKTPLTGDGAADLASSLNSVRNEPVFGQVALVPLDSVTDEFTEAWKLVVKAQTLHASKDPNSIPANLKPDAVESKLIELLPWAWKTGIKPDEKVQEKFGNLLQLARQKIDEAAAATEKRNNLNALLGPQTDESNALSANSGPVLVKTMVDGGKLLNFKQLTDLASFRAFHLMALLSAAHIHKLLTSGQSLTPTQLDTEVRLFNIARYLSAYFDAYFRGGQFIQFSVDEGSFVNNLSQGIAAKLKPGMTAAQIAAIIKPDFDNLCNGTGGKSGACGSQLGSTAFVSRAGLSVQFSGISYTVADKSGVGLSHVYPQVSEFGPQLIRVFVEAIFDANGRHLLGAPNATACQPDEKLFATSECMTANAKPDDKVAEIDMLATAAEAISSTATGTVVRGFAVGSTNNEVIAQMLETLAGVNARKITEKVLYLTAYGQACPIIPVAVHLQTDGKVAGAGTQTAAGE